MEDNQKNLMFSNLTWKCEICNRERPDSLISVYSYEINGLPGAVRNIKYCNDNSICHSLAVGKMVSNMKKFYITFGQKYPWRNGWVLIEAPDYNTAHLWVVQIFGSQYAQLLAEEDFDKSYFPSGQIGETIK